MSENISQIIERIKDKCGFKTEGEVAVALNMTHGALSNHKTRGTIPHEAIFTFCETNNTSIDWLLTGEGEISRQPEGVRAEPGSVAEKVLLVLKDMSEEDQREFLKRIEEKKLLSELLAEKKKRKNAG